MYALIVIEPFPPLVLSITLNETINSHRTSPLRRHFYIRQLFFFVFLLLFFAYITLLCTRWCLIFNFFLSFVYWKSQLVKLHRWSVKKYSISKAKNGKCTPVQKCQCVDILSILNYFEFICVCVCVCCVFLFAPSAQRYACAYRILW